MSGDALASGAKSAQFGTGGNGLSEVAWDLRTLTREEFVAKWPDKDYDKALAAMQSIKAGTK